MKQRLWISNFVIQSLLSTLLFALSIFLRRAGEGEGKGRGGEGEGEGRGSDHIWVEHMKSWNRKKCLKKYSRVRRTIRNKRKKKGIVTCTCQEDSGDGQETKDDHQRKGCGSDGRAFTTAGCSGDVSVWLADVADCGWFCWVMWRSRLAQQRRRHGCCRRNTI